MNEEPGQNWLQRFTRTFEKAVWLNPIPESHWQFTRSITMIQKLMNDRMFPLSIKGMEEAMAYLSK